MTTKPKKTTRQRPGPGEKSTGAAGIVEEVESGDRVRALLALRKHIAERLEEGVPARDLAALSRRLMQVIEELEALGEDDDAPTAEDELARRRAAVLSAAGVDGAATSGDAR